MSAQLRFLSGARAGTAQSLVRDETRLGRHPEAELQLHPEADVEVSAWHAAIARVGGRWLLRDLGSRNGTYLNGARIDAEVELHSGDRIRLGPTGPELEFTADMSEEATPAGGAPAAGMKHESVTQRIRAQVRRQTRLLRLIAAGLAVALAVSVGIFALVTRQQRRTWQRQRATLQQRVDSVLAASDTTVRQLRGQVGGLAQALRQSRSRVGALSSRLQQATASGPGSDEVAALKRQLQSVSAALARQQLAASLDFRGIRKANERAIAVIFVDFGDGQISSGTAFAVRPDGTFITNRHVVAGPGGDQSPSRIAIQFSGSRQVWPARLLATDQAADLAVVKVDNIVGSVPVIRGFNTRPDTLPAGSPVALLGYPLGGEDRGAMASAHVPVPLLTAGVINTMAPGRVQVLGYGAAGGSGSPILDRDGRVIGVLYGGKHEDAGQVLLGVPSPSVLKLLDGSTR